MTISLINDRGDWIDRLIANNVNLIIYQRRARDNTLKYMMGIDSRIFEITGENMRLRECDPPIKEKPIINHMRINAVVDSAGQTNEIIVSNAKVSIRRDVKTGIITIVCEDSQPLKVFRSSIWRIEDNKIYFVGRDYAEEKPPVATKNSYAIQFGDGSNGEVTYYNFADAANAANHMAIDRKTTVASVTLILDDPKIVAAKAFLTDISAVCQQHQLCFTLYHTDVANPLMVVPINPFSMEWLRLAHIDGDK